MIQFPPFSAIPVVNHLTGGAYRLAGADMEATPGRLREIAGICNERLVYEWLFRRRLEGVPYPENRAADWLQWSREGWEENTHFSFAVLGSRGEIVAACDIKSAEPDGAEIGYWASASHRGVMTNAVVAMCELAKAAGFRSLVATVRHGNNGSRGVLERCGFVVDSSRRDDERDVFSRSLDEDLG